MTHRCKGDDPNCSSGWVPVIEVHESKNGRRVVTETRPYGMDVVGDPVKYDEAWAVFDGQQAYEAVKPCRFCKGDWVPPEDRISDSDAEGRVEGRRKGGLWDEPVPTRKGLPE